MLKSFPSQTHNVITLCSSSDLELNENEFILKLKIDNFLNSVAFKDENMNSLLF